MQVATYPGARVVSTRGEILKKDDLDGFGQLGQQLLLDLILRPLLGSSNGAAVSGFWGDSMKVSLVSGRDFQAEAGIAFLTETAGTATTPAYKACVNPAVYEFEVPETVDPAKNRIDLLCVKAADLNEAESRDVKQLDSGGAMIPQSVTVRARPNRTFLLVQGVENISPAAPATPSGYTVAAELYVVASGSANNVIITDRRTQLRRLVDVMDARGPLVVSPDEWQADGLGGPDVRVAEASGKRYVYVLTTGAHVLVAPMDLPLGVGLVELKYYTHRVAAGGTFSLELIRVAADGTITVVDTTNIAATLGDVTTTKAISHTVLAGSRYLLRANLTNPSAGADLRIYGVQVGWNV